MTAFIYQHTDFSTGILTFTLSLAQCSVAHISSSKSCFGGFNEQSGYLVLCALSHLYKSSLLTEQCSVLSPFSAFPPPKAALSGQTSNGLVNTSTLKAAQNNQHLEAHFKLGESTSQCDQKSVEKVKILFEEKLLQLKL